MLKIYKFGGSILKNANDVKLVASVIANEKSINIFSAFFGITDSLIRVSKMSLAGIKGYEMQLEFIMNFHIDICKNLKIDFSFINDIHGEIKEILNSVCVLKDLSLKVLDEIISYGEILSTKIVCEYTKIQYIDARKIIKTDANYSKAKVNIDFTSSLVKQTFKENYSYIVAGFISSDDKNNTTTTLGRNGGDYTAALIASMLDADMIVIWKDVDGLSTANPKIVPTAIHIDKISYKEMAELSYFGNKIISLQALQPSIDKNIKIVLRNIYNLDSEGTIVSDKTNEEFGIKGISKIDDIVLVSVTGFYMVGISGFSNRVFSSLSSVGVSVVFITQSSSEIAICFGIKDVDLTKTETALINEFSSEIKENCLKLEIKENQSIIAIAGYGMINTPGVAGKIFSALGKANVNIVAIAQDFNEMSISFSVNDEQGDLAVKSIHDFLFEKKKIKCLIAGIGVVGSAVIKMLEKNDRFQVVGSFNTKEYNGESYKDINEIIEKFKNVASYNYVLIDCTSSQELADNYDIFIKNGFNIVAPNKKANTMPLDNFLKLQDTLKLYKKHFMYEANVGAGLPIISTIKDLLFSGDEIIKIEGILSGTLSYIFNNISLNKSFSDV
ncbi:MAG: aspartate kinase, partial [Rickettsiales bacterium]|nr:aspartate kinase [Rickettsiales bacterium]